MVRHYLAAGASTASLASRSEGVPFNKQIDLRPAQQFDPLEPHYGVPVIDALRGREYTLSE